MAATYIPIASTTLSTSAASVTFSSIPGTYTDLVLRYSIRSDQSGQINSILVRFNSDTNTNYSYRGIRNVSGTVDNISGSNRTNIVTIINGTSSTSNTFTNSEIYIPNYLGSVNKPISVVESPEDNSTNQIYNYVTAQLWRNTSAITSISFSFPAAGNFVSGSTFHLYGIKNS